MPAITEQEYSFFKENVSPKEYRIYKYLDNLNFKFIPKLYDYDKITCTLRTQKINGLSISDYYGESFEEIPRPIINQIRNIITQLYNIGIVYPDITGYNFIEDNKGAIWIVDFEHCFYKNIHENKIDTNADTDTDTDIILDAEDHINFVSKFCFKKQQSWNPYFA
jgi:tRNA A-37 threonylcarbamoyl transferase component Bud32